jgi:fermentation-respiration switch protein FrsA (DUF1100 family)
VIILIELAQPVRLQHRLQWLGHPPCHDAGAWISRRIGLQLERTHAVRCKIRQCGLDARRPSLHPRGIGPRPAIVVSHPASGVKEQAAGLYAQRLARLGFITLTFDAAHHGESEGEPRGFEDPFHRVEDIKAAVSFLSVNEAVDPDRIGALGICASGGYVVSAAAADHRIKAMAIVSGVDVARQFRYGADGTQPPAVFQSMLDAAAAARTAEARGEEMGRFPLFPSGNDQTRCPHLAPERRICRHSRCAVAQDIRRQATQWDGWIHPPCCPPAASSLPRRPPPSSSSRSSRCVGSRSAQAGE